VELTAAQVAVEMEGILQKNIKSRSLTDEAYNYMALLVAEDCPKNARELFGLIGDFLTDGMAYTEEEGQKLCMVIQKHFLDRKLIKIDDSRDTIIAEKLSKPITINDLKEAGHSGIVREDDFSDPLLATGRDASGNYNTNEDKEAWIAKKKSKQRDKDAKEQDALDRKIDEFMSTKAKVPPPEVVHDKSNHSKADLYSPKVTLIAGGKALLSEAVLRLARGRKYGLVGRNGIGKTTLINAMCRREIDKLPMNLHIL